MDHKTEVIQIGSEWVGRCSCKAHGNREPAWSVAEDWVLGHQSDVQRARSHLRGRAPSLRDQYLYYRQMQDDPLTPRRERALWKVLADGLEHRLGLTEDTASMFEEAR